MKNTTIIFGLLIVVLFSCQPSSDSSASAIQSDKARASGGIHPGTSTDQRMVDIAAERFRDGSNPQVVYGKLFPEDANYTVEQALSDERGLLEGTEYAERQDNTLIIVSLRFESVPRDTFWFQGITNHGFLVILHTSVKEGIGYRDMLLVNPNRLDLYKLPNTSALYELTDGTLIQRYSSPIPGQANGGIRIWEVGSDLELVQKNEFDFPNRWPADIKIVGSESLLVQLHLDDAGESPPQYVEILYLQ